MARKALRGERSDGKRGSPVRGLAAAVVLMTVAAAAGWALAFPQSSLAPALARGLADGAAVITLGLAVVPRLEDGRHRAALAEAARRPLTIAAAVWLLVEVVRVALSAAAATDVSVFAISLRTCAEFAVHTAAGRASLISAVAAGVVCLVSLGTAPHGPAGIAFAGTAAAGVVARTVAGHLAADGVGAVALAAHALAAAVWCGTLAALMLTVRHRGQWARVLPKFSQLSLVTVTVLLVGGIFGAVVMLDSVGALYATGYGRVLSAKVVVMTVLLAMGWVNRTRWLPAARAHRTSAEVSYTRSAVEVSVMAVAIALAAALSVTG